MNSDLRFALRQIVQKPGFACTAIAILALGIGSSAAVFSALYQILLRPLPYPAPGQLMSVHNSFPSSQTAVTGMSGFDYAELRKHRDVFSDSGIFYWNDLTLTGVGAARHIDAVNASASMFATFGVKAEMGRTYSEAEDQYGAAKTAVLSDGFWRSALAADPAAVGRTIHLDGKLYTVVGVMPASFQFPSLETQLWIPVALRASEFTFAGGRSEKWLHMAARLAPGATQLKADAALQSISGAFASRFPAFYPGHAGWRFVIRPLAEEQTDHYRTSLRVAFGAVLSVLMIAWINVSGLMLIRAAARNGEIAVRIALGASKSRIVRQTLAETGVLAFAGCGLGLLLAAWAVQLINLYGPLPQPASIGGWTVLFVLGLGVLTTVAAGLLPAMVTAGLRVNEVLQSKASRTTTGGGAWRNAIAAGQIGLAVILIFTATSLSRSFLNLTRVRAGFDGRRVWSGALEIADSKFEPLINLLKTLPGVDLASGCSALPFNPSGVWTERIRFPERAKTNPAPEAQIGLAMPNYFEAMRIPLLRGRYFTEEDRAGSAPAAVIDEELARRYFPHEDALQDALGRKVAVGGADTGATIVGVVGSVHNSELGGPVAPEIYRPKLQERSEAMYLVLRMKNDSDPTEAVRDAIAKVDRSVALYDVAFMDQRVAGSLRVRRFVAFLLNAFAAVGTALAAVGLYASLAHLVELRRREIGIRIALGARQAQIGQIFFGQGGMVASAGLVLGIAGALAAGRIVRAQLFGVELTDGETWSIVMGGIALVLFAAASVPAWRAGRTDPSEILRAE